MSVQRNQFIIFGVALDYTTNYGNSDDAYKKFEPFMDDNAFKGTVKHKEGIFALVDGMNGEFLIIGRVLAKAEEGTLLAEGKPLQVPELSELEKELICESIERNFEIEKADEKAKYYCVTKYR